MTMIDLDSIKQARAVRLLPWSHLASPTARFELAGHVIDYLLSCIEGRGVEDVKASYSTAHPVRYLMTHAVHPDIVVLWFLAMKSHWFEDRSNMFFGMREQAQAFLYKWVETGELADDNTTLEIATKSKFKEWLESSWTTTPIAGGERCAECVNCGHANVNKAGYCKELVPDRGSEAYCGCKCVFPAPPDRNHAITILRELRTSDPDEVARQKESWRQLREDLNSAPPEAPFDHHPTCSRRGGTTCSCRDVSTPVPAEATAQGRNADNEEVSTCANCAESIIKEPGSDHWIHELGWSKKCISDKIVATPSTATTGTAVEAAREIALTFTTTEIAWARLTATTDPEFKAGQDALVKLEAIISRRFAPTEAAIPAGEQKHMTTTVEHPISKHVDDYVKSLNWSPTATDDVKTLVIGNLRGFAAHLASIESDVDILDDERVDKELRRWQDAIRDKLISLGAPDHLIDGAGCDSGDPLDFTLAEVGQGAGYFVDQVDELKSRLSTARADAIDEAAAAVRAMFNLDYSDGDGLRTVDPRGLEAIAAALATLKQPDRKDD